MAEKTTNYNLTKPSADDFYDVGVQNSNMDIVDAELKKLERGKAPEGHGLGGLAKEISDISFLETLKKGGGFYQVGYAEDTPATGETSRLNLIQCVRSAQEDMETGVQLVFYDWTINNPRFWMRNVLKGIPGNWVEMLHTGNYSNYANARITIGSYVGVIGSEKSSEVVLSFDFPPKLILLRGKDDEDEEITAIFLRGCYGTYIYVYASNSVSSHTIPTTWEGNTVKLTLDKYESKNLNYSGNIYTHVAIG